MQADLTNTQVVIGAFALILTMIFALAAFLDKRWIPRARLRDFGSDQKPHSLRRSSSRDDKEESSTLYTRYADLSAKDFGAAEQQITFRGEKQRNVTGD